jgi:methylenetetrahydrofolate dehydrogenase (NADP+)/methenyltetrahydrofolate cyclohydrolase
MGAQIIDGFAIAADLRGHIAARVAEAVMRGGPKPCLAVILVGENPASVSYVTAKQKALAECGMDGKDIRLKAGIQPLELLGLVNSLNDDPGVHGILVQLPLPPVLTAVFPKIEQELTQAISPAKDVDGLHPVNAGLVALGRVGEAFVPCTAQGVLYLLDVAGGVQGAGGKGQGAGCRVQGAGCRTEGKRVVVVGRSALVGRPLSVLLSLPPRNATVTLCHSKTADLAAECRRADILIAAAGVPGLIKADMVKPGATVIDVGTTRITDNTVPKGWRLAGDVDFAAVKEVAAFITPVPRGVGPLTVAMLLRNTAQAAGYTL